MSPWGVGAIRRPIGEQMKVQLLQRYIDHQNGRKIIYGPGEIIDIPHGQLLIERNKALPVPEQLESNPVQLTEAPPGRRGRPKGK